MLDEGLVDIAQEGLILLDRPLSSHRTLQNADTLKYPQLPTRNPAITKINQ